MNPICLFKGHIIKRQVSGSHGTKWGTVDYHDSCSRRFCLWKRNFWRKLPARMVQLEVEHYNKEGINDF